MQYLGMAGYCENAVSLVISTENWDAIGFIYISGYDEKAFPD